MKFAKFAGLLTLGGVIAVGCDSSGGGDVDSGNDLAHTGGNNGSDGSVGGNGATNGTGGGSSNSGGQGSSVGGSGNASGSGSAGNLGGMGGELPTDIDFDYDPNNDAKPQTCAATQIESEEVFLDMFVMLDRSASMTEDFGIADPRGFCDVGGPSVDSRWCNAITALYGFFEDPSTVGTGVSYSAFGSTGCVAFDMDLPFALLEPGDQNGQLAALLEALNAEDPVDYTQTEGAVRTLIEATTGHVPEGTRKTISVLITDGEPLDPPGVGGPKCLENGVDELSQLNDLMVDHFTSSGIPSFVVGMDGVSAANLETLAQGAGAEPHSDYCLGEAECSYYSVGAGNPAAFIAALQSIRGQVLGCEYTVPKADVGVENLSTLSVAFTPATGADALELVRVTAAADCSQADQYWVDVQPGEDPVIKLCPATCDSRGAGASVDISLKCEGS